MCRIFLAVLLTMTISVAQDTASSHAKNATAADVPGLQELLQMTARFAPTPLEVSTADLSAGDKTALVKLIQAAHLVNHIFMRKIWSGDLQLYRKLQQDQSPLGRERLHYFWINKCPWSEIDGHKAFLPDVP